ENETPEPFFEGLCFQCRSDGRESHRELRGGLLFGSGGGVLASRPNSSSLPYHSCYSGRVESGVYCSWTDPCPQTRFRSGIGWKICINVSRIPNGMNFCVQRSN